MPGGAELRATTRGMACRGDCRLTQANAAVIHWDAAIGEQFDGVIGAFELLVDQLSQQFVLKHTTG